MVGTKPTFFFFGCWNRDTNVGKIDNRGMVLKNLADSWKDFDFGIIAGDNVYPIKNVLR